MSALVRFCNRHPFIAMTFDALSKGLGIRDEWFYPCLHVRPINHSRLGRAVTVGRARDALGEDRKG